MPKFGLLKGNVACGMTDCLFTLKVHAVKFHLALMRPIPQTRLNEQARGLLTSSFGLYQSVVANKHVPILQLRLAISHISTEQLFSGLVDAGVTAGDPSLRLLINNIGVMVDCHILSDGMRGSSAAENPSATPQSHRTISASEVQPSFGYSGVVICLVCH
ncbi:hypothetical protein HZ326_14200 [Fusarium oxysporum f. sp. albedinis]|nr:hypothetical protein HZ326_14200 [Fusarium oxysporum f. sp. albedinis]